MSSITTIPKRRFFIAINQKSRTTNGGDSLTGDNTREINTVKKNNINGVSLANNQITLVPGDYLVRASAGAHRPDRHQLRLKNITLSRTEVSGLNAFSNDNENETGVALLNGTFSINQTCVFKLIHAIQKSRTVIGLGVDLDSEDLVNAENSVFCQISIEKIG